METTYKIVRMFFEGIAEETIKSGLTLEEAKEHCSDLETSSSTCSSVQAIARTLEKGDWFDGYESEGE